MMSDLFYATHGDYFDIASDAERTANWLQRQGVDQLVYLDKDASYNFGLSSSRNALERLKLQSSESAPEMRRDASYNLESLEKFRKLAQYCESLRIPILDPQGPLVIVDVQATLTNEPSSEHIQCLHSPTDIALSSSRTALPLPRENRCPTAVFFSDSSHDHDPVETVITIAWGDDHDRLNAQPGRCVMKRGSAALLASDNPRHSTNGSYRHADECDQ
jgi:hypothetical protein